MPTWQDYGPDIPYVDYLFDDGRRLPVPRSMYEAGGFVPKQEEPPAPPMPIGQPPDAAPVDPWSDQARQGRFARDQARDMATSGIPAVPSGPGGAAGPAVAGPPGSAAAPAVVGPPGAAAGVPAAGAPGEAPQYKLQQESRAPLEIDAISGGQLPPPSEPVPVDEGAPAPRMLGDVAGPPGPRSQQDVDQQYADEVRRQIEATSYAMGIEQTLAERERAEEKQRLEQQWQEYQDAQRKASDHKIDPGRKWASMSTGRKIGVIIAAALSGLGSAMKGQGDRNPALDIIKSAIDEDIALQMADRDELGRDVARKRGALDDLGAMFRNHEAERQARMGAMLQREAQGLREAAARALSDGVKFIYESLAAQMQAEAEKTAVDAFWKEQEFGVKAAKAQAEIDKLQAETRKLLGGLGGGGGLAGKTGTEGRYASLDQIDPKYRDKAVRLADGSWVLVASSTAANKANEQLANSRSFVNNIDRALTKIASLPNFAEKAANRMGWTTEDVAVIEQELTQLQTQGKEFYALGALSKEDLQLMINLGADPKTASQFIQQGWAKLQNWRRGIVQDTVDKVQQYGVDIPQDERGGYAGFGAAPERAQPPGVKEIKQGIVTEPTRDKGKIVSRVTAGDVDKRLRELKGATQREDDDPFRYQNELGALRVESRDNLTKQQKRVNDMAVELTKVSAKKDKKSQARAKELSAQLGQERRQLADYQAIVTLVDKEYEKEAGKRKKREEDRDKAKEAVQQLQAPDPEVGRRMQEAKRRRGGR